MPNIKSAKIRAKQNEKRRLRNKAIKTFIRHLRRNVFQTLTEKMFTIEEAQKELNAFKKQVDKAWSKGVLPRNTSSRMKSSMELLFKKNYSI
ncbi:small subunit ribosomal protein S20 [Brevinema andersonii]|uniref:Small ribosomal subunit protein bS20 n=1 Tax=Brevinema andersonii TaxID=34097 RepID=A0A1I1D400_BREAD|nr:30S ribosomal protein S20 [Brevinema andersonii]SFB67818.1 small subunit ribosomal protein S20 [Brevinema andersonii]